MSLKWPTLVDLISVCLSLGRPVETPYRTENVIACYYFIISLFQSNKQATKHDDDVGLRIELNF